MDYFQQVTDSDNHLVIVMLNFPLSVGEEELRVRNVDRHHGQVTARPIGERKVCMIPIFRTVSGLVCC